MAVCLRKPQGGIHREYLIASTSVTNGAIVVLVVLVVMVVMVSA